MQLQPNQGNVGLSLCEPSRASEVVLEIGTLSRNLGTWGGYLGTLDASILMRARSRSMGSRCVVACCIGRGVHASEHSMLTTTQAGQVINQVIREDPAEAGAPKHWQMT